MRGSLITSFARWLGIVIPPLWAMAHILSGGASTWLGNITVLGFALFLSLIWLSSPLSYMNRDFLEIGYTIYDCFTTLKKEGFKWVKFWHTILKGRSALSVLILFWLGMAGLLALLSMGSVFELQNQNEFVLPQRIPLNESALIVDGIPIEELGYLALLPYLNDNVPQESLLGWRKAKEDSPCNSVHCSWTFIHDESRTRVVSFPGGISRHELALNCALFGNSIIFKLVSAIFPSSCFDDLPPALDIMANVPNLFWQSDIDAMIPKLAQEIFDLIKSNRSTYRTFFVGHGRGGSFAALLGAGLGVRTVIFGSPGIEVLRHRFASILPLLERREALAAILVSVTNSYDFISSIDAIPDGKFYQLPCNFQFSNPLHCHLASSIFASLSKRNLQSTFKQERIYLSSKLIRDVRKLVVFTSKSQRAIIPDCWGEDPFTPLITTKNLTCGPVHHLI